MIDKLSTNEKTNQAARTIKKSTRKRIMHPFGVRKVRVTRIEDIAKDIRRITLAGGELSDFQSVGSHDHVKIFFPLANGTINHPTVVNGRPKPADGESISRDYTVYAFRKEKLEIDIDFIIHGSGPASNWAETAKIGNEIVIAGPRGSLLLPEKYEETVIQKRGSHQDSLPKPLLLIADNTAFAALGRTLRKLPANSSDVITFGTDEDQTRHYFTSTLSMCRTFTFVKIEDEVDLTNLNLSPTLTKLLPSYALSFIGENSLVYAIFELYISKLNEDSSITNKNLKLSGNKYNITTNKGTSSTLNNGTQQLSYLPWGFIWGAGEASALIPVRRFFRTFGLQPIEELEIKGYWKKGVVALDHHAPLDDQDPDPKPTPPGSKENPISTIGIK